MSCRFRVFIAVGVVGFVLQVAVVAMLTELLGWSATGSTALGVEAAILHNFLGHERWTWRDRKTSSGSRLRRLLQFQLTTGVTSVAGNVLLVLVGVAALGLGPVVANCLAVGAMSLANYLVADRCVFRRVQTAALVVVLGLMPGSADAAELTSQTLAAWTRHVAATEASLTGAPVADGLREPSGRETRIPGGIVHEWRGSVFIAGITVPQLVEALIHPGTPPPQDDVVESRVLAHHGDSLRVYLKLVRTAIITVTYDTEHDVTFVRHDSQFATSRSVATRIAEAGGNDRGFLWKLNSYWEYRQIGDGVQVDLVSLSLSRSMPLVLKPLVGPIVNRIARESMTRTLDAVRRFGEALPGHAAPMGPRNKG